MRTLYLSVLSALFIGLAMVLYRSGVLGESALITAVILFGSVGITTVMVHTFFPEP